VTPPARDEAQLERVVQLLDGPDYDRPFEVAQHLVARDYTRAGVRTLHTHHGEVLAWDGAAYQVLEPAALRARLYRVASSHPKGARRRLVDDYVDALVAATHLPAATVLPAWLDPRPDDPPAADLIAARNGLVEIRTGRLLPASPRYLSRWVLPFAYVADLPTPARWRAFLAELWPDDPGSIQLLREWYGLQLVPDTSYQKALLMYGPKRSGKGTLLRVLQALLGAGNSCAPTLASLAQRFGMSCLLGRLAAIVSDARVSSRTDAAALAECVLRLTGEDMVTVERKYLPDVTTTLTARLTIATNELPRFRDDAGALASRFVTLGLTRSYYGCEDPTLTDQLLAELPGIFVWALTGLDALRERGRLVQPESSAALGAELELLGSPVRAFLAEAVVVAPTAGGLDVRELYDAWCTWCEQRRQRAGNEQTFGAALRAALPALPRPLPQRRTDAGVRRYYPGLRLRSAADA
jgi:putative DNA primase/helicase